MSLCGHECVYVHTWYLCTCICGWGCMSFSICVQIRGLTRVGVLLGPLHGLWDQSRVIKLWVWQVLCPLNHPVGPSFSFQPVPRLICPAPPLFAGCHKRRRKASLGASVLTTVPTVWTFAENPLSNKLHSSSLLMETTGERSCWKGGALSLGWHSSVGLLSQGKERYILCVTEARAQQTSTQSLFSKQPL